MTAFWEIKSLNRMSKEEWEALCDGCGLCCLNKFIDKDTSEIFYTMVACKLFDDRTCKCRDYPNRKRMVPNCINLFRENGWTKLMPPTCAYRLLREKKSLPDWHYLISKKRNLVHTLGISAKRRTICESTVDPDEITNYVIFKA